MSSTNLNILFCNKVLSIIAKVVVTLFLFTHNANANPFTKATSITCNFPVGGHADWETGKPIERESSFGEDVTFHSFDFANGAAKMTGNAGTVNIKVFTTDLGITLLEWIDGDVVVVTTAWAYTVDGNPNKFSAVHSRHRILDHPTPAQYHGTCSVS